MVGASSPGGGDANAVFCGFFGICFDFAKICIFFCQFQFCWQFFSTMKNSCFDPDFALKPEFSSIFCHVCIIVCKMKIFPCVLRVKSADPPAPHFGLMGRTCVFFVCFPSSLFVSKVRYLRLCCSCCPSRFFLGLLLLLAFVHISFECSPFFSFRFVSCRVSVPPPGWHLGIFIPP